MLLVAFVSLEIYVLRKIWRDLEKTASLFLIGYTMSFLVRMINVIIRVFIETQE